MRSASSALSVPSTILLFPPASPHHPQTLGLFTIYFQTGSCRTFICALQGMETRQRGGAGRRGWDLEHLGQDRVDLVRLREAGQRRLDPPQRPPRPRHPRLCECVCALGDQISEWTEDEEREGGRENEEKQGREGWMDGWMDGGREGGRKAEGGSIGAREKGGSQGEREGGKGGRGMGGTPPQDPSSPDAR